MSYLLIRVSFLILFYLGRQRGTFIFRPILELRGCL